MRCPHCGTDSTAGGYCDRCGQRLFVWLGDPLGAAEPRTPHAAVSPPRSRPSASNVKVLTGLAAICVVVVIAPVWSGLMFLGFLFVLWRWPGIGWQPWSLLLGGALLLAVISQMLGRAIS